MIRPTTQQDALFISNLAATFNRFGPYVPVFEALFRGEHLHDVLGEIEFLIANDAGKSAGFIALEWRERVCHIHGVVVHADFLRLGVATDLLNHVAQLARTRGIGTLECITAETGNMPALSCLTRWGFTNNGYNGLYPNGQRAVHLSAILK